MADIETQYPTTPSFTAVNFQTNVPTISTETFSGKVRRVGYGHQFYEWEVQYPNLTESQAAIVQGYLAQTYGPLLSFEIALPKISTTKSTNPPSTTVNVNNASGYTAGAKQVVLENCGANKDVLNVGDFFKFNNHSKVYQATSTCVSDGSGAATLFFAGSLVSAVPDDTALTLTDVKFTALALTEAQQVNVGIGGISNLNVKMREIW